MNAIKLRMKSVTGTRQITRAMELVSTSKLRRAKERAEKSRPYHTKISESLSELIRLDGREDSVFFKKRECKTTCYIVLAGDRGLAGGYNSNIFKFVDSDAAGKDITVLPVGKKAIEHYARKSYPTIDAGYGSIVSVGNGGAGDIASLLCTEYLSGRIDRAVVVYTEFVSMLTQKVVCEQLLPLNLDSKSDKNNNTAQICDTSPEELINALVPFCVSGILYSALCEAEASEQGSRRNAMSAATKNAGEILDNLNLGYNRARQAAITSEITEIVSGANAL